MAFRLESSLWCFLSQTEFWKSSPPSPPFLGLGGQGVGSVGGGGGWVDTNTFVCVICPPLPSPPPVPSPAPQFQFEIKFNFSFLNSDWNQKHHCMLESRKVSLRII